MQKVKYYPQNKLDYSLRCFKTKVAHKVFICKRKE